MDADTIFSISTYSILQDNCIISPTLCEAIVSLNDTIFYEYNYPSKKFSFFEYNAEVAYAIRKLKRHQLEKYYIPINMVPYGHEAPEPTKILIIRQNGDGCYNVEERSSRYDALDDDREDRMGNYYRPYPF
jgi:hypothetical protein